MTPMNPLEATLALTLRVKELEAEVSKSRGELASTVDLLNIWARESGVEESKDIFSTSNLANRIWSDQSAKLNKAEAALATCRADVLEEVAKHFYDGPFGAGTFIEAAKFVRAMKGTKS